MQKKIMLAIFFIGSFMNTYAQQWKSGIVTEEFIFEKAPFPSCHAATIEETADGLVAAWFGGTHERHPDVGIWVSRKGKDEKWTEPVEVANGLQPDGSRLPTWNPVLFQVPNGELLLFYKIGPKPSAWQGWMIASKDGGKTWSEPRSLPDGYVGPVKNKPVLLDNGQLFCASSTEGNGWKIHFEVTEDFGKTWKKIGPIEGNGFDAIQPSILNHGKGKLQVLCRSKNRAVIESWSYDNGQTWTPLSKTTLPNNNSGTDAVTLANGKHLLIYNHVLAPGDLAKGPRTPLHVSLSKDGKNWEAALILEDSHISQYSYPSIIQSSDGYVHAIYTWRRERIKYVKIDPAKLKTKKIKDGLWPGTKTAVVVIESKPEEE